MFIVSFKHDDSFRSLHTPKYAVYLNIIIVVLETYMYIRYASSCLSLWAMLALLYCRFDRGSHLYK